MFFDFQLTVCPLSFMMAHNSPTQTSSDIWAWSVTDINLNNDAALCPLTPGKKRNENYASSEKAPHIN